MEEEWQVPCLAKQRNEMNRRRDVFFSGAAALFLLAASILVITNSLPSTGSIIIFFAFAAVISIKGSKDGGSGLSDGNGTSGVAKSFFFTAAKALVFTVFTMKLFGMF